MCVCVCYMRLLPHSLWSKCFKIWAFIFQSELDTLQAYFDWFKHDLEKILYTRKVMSDLRQKRALLLKSVKLPIDLYQSK